MVDTNKGLDDALNSNQSIKILNEKDSEIFINSLVDLHKLKKDIDDKPTDSSTFVQLAQAFLVKNGLCDEVKNHIRLLNFQNNFYQYVDGRYEMIAANYLKKWIMRWLVESFHPIAKRSFRDEIFSIIEAIVQISSKTMLGIWLDQPKEDNVYFINIKNGIIRFNKGEIKLIDHSPSFFSTSQLPVTYRQEPKCEIFHTFLKKVQPSSIEQKYLQEWLGYMLIYETSLETFTMFYGEGANGKSVFLTIIKAILGTNNFSSVGLEGFNPQRTFNLAATDGKLANVVEELNDMTKAAEGLLKQFVSGQPINVEKKFQDPYDMVPTARITISTNTLPNFYDPSNGLWRRLNLLHWNVIIPDKEKNINYLKTSFWNPELSGILNWGLEGLTRLLKRGYFEVSPEMKLGKKEFQLEKNPAHDFLTTYCVTDLQGEEAEYKIYDAYRDYCHNSGNHPFNIKNFNKELKRLFREVERDKNPRAYKTASKKCRYWKGIRLNA